MNKFTFASRSVVFVVFTVMVWALASVEDAQSVPPAKQPARPIAPRPMAPGAKQLPPTPRISPPRAVATRPSFTSRVKAFFGKKTPPEPTLIGQANMYDFRESTSTVADKYPGGKDAIFQALPDFETGTPPTSTKYSDLGGKDEVFAPLPDFSNGPPPSIANAPARNVGPLPRLPSDSSPPPTVGVVSGKIPMLAVKGASSPGKRNPQSSESQSSEMSNVPPSNYDLLPPSAWKAEVIYSPLPGGSKPVQKINKANIVNELKDALESSNNPVSSPPLPPTPPTNFGPPPPKPPRPKQ